MVKVPTLFALLLSIVVLEGAHATQVAYQAPSQLGVSSSVVARGKVVGVRSFWNEAHTKIFTETRIALDETYKGAATGEVRLLQLGGTVGTFRVTVHGATMWKQGEEVLLFLEDYVGGSYHVAGFSQGKFDIERDEKGRAFVRQPSLEGLMRVGPDGKAVLNEPVMERVPLERFVDQALSGNEGGQR